MAGDAICDWLDVTYGPTDCPYPDLNLFLLGLEFTATRDRAGGVLYAPPIGRGVIKVLHSSRFAKISFSGGVCAYLRSICQFEPALGVLCSSPHKVTRLDAAMDYPVDAADVICHLLRRYPSGEVSLMRKTMALTRFTSVRTDGRESGTLYVGYRSAARFTARVYDKSLEALEKRAELLPATTRFEVTARKDAGATLRDAALPNSLFWHIAAPALLNRPEGIPVWSPNTDFHWSSTKREFDPAMVLQRRIDASAEIDSLISVADALGDSGRKYLLHLLSKRVMSSGGLAADERSCDVV